MLPHRFSVQLKENNICAACSCWRWHPPQCGSSSPLALRSSGCSAAWEQPAAAAGGFLLSSEPVPLCLGTALLKGMELHDGCQCSDTALGWCCSRATVGASLCPLPFLTFLVKVQIRPAVGFTYGMEDTGFRMF